MPSAPSPKSSQKVRGKAQTPAVRLQPARDPTILLVDDDPAVLEALRRVLRLEGWSVISASSGEEALEYLNSHHADLMITDLSMDAVSGWDLLFHENMQRPRLPVFVITALPRTHIAGADKFADEFFEKPIDIDVLLAAARRYVAAM